MPKLMFAWLGSGRARRLRVAAAGCNLDQAARAGLPVPPGAVLLDQFFRFALDNDLATLAGNRILITDTRSLHATVFESVRLPRFEAPMMIQPLATAAVSGSDYGPKAVARVDSRDPEQFALALAKAWSAVDPDDPQLRHDVLLMESVAATANGTALSCADVSIDTVQEAFRSIKETASGIAVEIAAELPRLTGWRLPDEDLSPHIQRLQMLLRGVRRSLGRGNWAVTWADDGHICWLLDVREVTPASG